jgi:hypothetical protein
MSQDDPIAQVIARLPDEAIRPALAANVQQRARMALAAESGKWARVDHFFMDRLMPVALAGYAAFYAFEFVTFLGRFYVG